MNFEDPKCIMDLAFLVDITQEINISVISQHASLLGKRTQQSVVRNMLLLLKAYSRV